MSVRLVTDTMPDDDFFEDDSTPPPTKAESETAPAGWDALVTSVPAEWFTTRPPRREWLLRDKRRPRADGVLPLGKVGQFIAAGGVGKTMLLVELAIAVSAGWDWIGSFSTPSTGGVLLLLGEEDSDEVHRRIYRTAGGRTHPSPGSIVVMPLAGHRCAFLEHDERGNSAETAFIYWLRDYVSKRAFKLIVIDPLSRFAGPDAEKDNAEGTRFVQVCESLATLTGATVLFSHHTNKLQRTDGAEVTGAGGRGSSSLFDGCRWEASLGLQRVRIEDPETRERLGELVTLSFTKSNYSRRAEPLLLRRGDGGALVPLDEEDLATVSDARDGASDRRRASGVQSALGLENLRRDAALVAAMLVARPGIGMKALKVAMRVTQGVFSDGRTAGALEALGGAVATLAGPRGAKPMYLDGTKLQADVVALVPETTRPAVLASLPPSGETS